MQETQETQVQPLGWESFCLFILLQTNPVRFHFYEVPGGGGGFVAKLCQTVLHKVLRRVKFIESESTWVDAKGQGSRDDGLVLSGDKVSV